MAKKLTKAIARKVLAVVDAGLCNGLGTPEPGKMCVEAAVNYALGLPHGDNPEDYVAPAFRALKIALNDQAWASNEARAAGMRRLAIAQLGTGGTLDEQEFAKRVALFTVQTIVPLALRAALLVHTDTTQKEALEAAAIVCERSTLARAAESARNAAESASSAAESVSSAAWSASSAAWSASSAAWSASSAADSADQVRCIFAEGVVQIAISMGTPGSKWLSLTEDTK